MTDDDIQALIKEGLALKAALAAQLPVIQAAQAWEDVGTRRLLHLATCQQCTDDGTVVCAEANRLRRILIERIHDLHEAIKRLPRE